MKTLSAQFFFVDSPLYDAAGSQIQIQITRRIWNRNKNYFMIWIRGSYGANSWKKRVQKIWRYCPFKPSLHGQNVVQLRVPGRFWNISVCRSERGPPHYGPSAILDCGESSDCEHETSFFQYNFLTRSTHFWGPS